MPNCTTSSKQIRTVSETCTCLLWRWPCPSLAVQPCVWPAPSHDQSPLHDHSSSPFPTSSLSEYLLSLPVQVCQGQTHDLMLHWDANANVCSEGARGSGSQRLRFSQSMPLASLICLSISPLSRHLQLVFCPAEPTESEPLISITREHCSISIPTVRHHKPYKISA